MTRDDAKPPLFRFPQAQRLDNAPQQCPSHGFVVQYSRLRAPSLFADDLAGTLKLAKEPTNGAAEVVVWPKELAGFALGNSSTYE